MAYEYMIEEWETFKVENKIVNRDTETAMLNRHGKNGWECFYVCDENSYTKVFYFRRVIV